MTVEAIFIGPAGLRAGWRALLWVIAVIVPLVVFIEALKRAPGVPPLTADTITAPVAMAGNAVLVIPFFVVTWLFVRFLDKRPLSSVGLGLPAAGSLAIGTVAGLVAIASGWALVSIMGAADVEPSGLPVAILGFAVLLFFSAAWEELFFRGYAFQWIARGAGFWVATLLTAFLFGAVHLANPSASAFSFVLIVLSGVLLAFARVASRDLWVPIGLHFGWNAAQGLLFGVPVSGIKGFPSILETKLDGHELVTGGEFGFEGSIGGLLALVTAFAFLVLLARRRTPDWRMEGGSQGPTSVDKGPQPEPPGEGGGPGAKPPETDRGAEPPVGVRGRSPWKQ